MAEYRYLASDRTGMTQQGTVTAATSHDAAELVRGRGLVLIRLSQSGQRGARFALTPPPAGGRQAAAGEGAKQPLSAGGRISARDLSIFTSQLGTMLNAGLSVTKSLDVQSKQVSNPRLRVIIEDLKRKVESGLSLSGSLAGYPQVFSSLYISMVRAGETSGDMGNSLIKMATFLERDVALQRKIKGALSYPVIVLVAAVVIVLGLFIFVLPQFVSFLTALNVPLPVPTRMTLAMSSYLVHRWYVVFGVAALVIFGVRTWLRTPAGIQWKDRTALSAPIIGPLVLKTAMARFTDTLSTLFGAGVPLIQCLDMTAGTMGNTVIEQTIQGVIDSIKQGSSLSAALAESKFFTPMVIQMASVGEESGSLEAMLSKVAVFYQAEVDTATETLTNAINPILIIVVGVMIGWVLISLYMPIFSMANYIQ